jgi:transcriptional regulator with XRE-family HTH domain
MQQGCQREMAVIDVIWDLEDDPDGNVYPGPSHHRVRGTTAPREAEMSTTRKKPLLSPDIAAIRERSRRERPGPDERIDRGELDELVPQAQYVALRALMARFRGMRERQELSLADVSEKTGLTPAAIIRLENGWNVNPTLETLYRYAEAIGAELRLEDGQSAGKISRPADEQGKTIDRSSSTGRPRRQIVRPHERKRMEKKPGG